MLLSDYIEKLQKFLELNGDMHCVFSSDDEGNNYQKLNSSPSLFYCDNIDEYSLNIYFKEELEEEELEEEDYDDFESVCLIN